MGYSINTASNELPDLDKEFLDQLIALKEPSKVIQFIKERPLGKNYPEQFVRILLFIIARGLEKNKKAKPLRDLCLMTSDKLSFNEFWASLQKIDECFGSSRKAALSPRKNRSNT